MKSELKTYTVSTTIMTIKLTAKDIIRLLRQEVEVADDASVSFDVPGGVGWSNCNIEGDIPVMLEDKLPGPLRIPHHGV